MTYNSFALCFKIKAISSYLDSFIGMSHTEMSNTPSCLVVLDQFQPVSSQYCSTYIGGHWGRTTRLIIWKFLFAEFHVTNIFKRLLERHHPMHH